MLSTPGSLLHFPPPSFFEVLKIFSTDVSIWDQFSKYHLRSEVPALKSLRKVNLDTNYLVFILHLIFTEHFFYTSVIYQLSSLSGRTSISDVLQMIQFKWFIVGSHIFSKLFLRISFGQTYYTLKFNLQEGFFFFLFSLEKTSTFERCLLVSKRFLNSAIKPFLPQKQKIAKKKKSWRCFLYGIYLIQLKIHNLWTDALLPASFTFLITSILTFMTTKGRRLAEELPCSVPQLRCYQQTFSSAIQT